MSKSRDTGDTARTLSQNRRAFSRRRAVGSASYRPADNLLAQRIRVTLTDVSYGGVGFSTAEELGLGQRIALEIHSSVPGVASLIFEAEVRWVAPTDVAAEFQIGCSWSQRLSYGELQQVWQQAR